MVIFEVAESSLTHDQTQKAHAYAASGIPEYWIVNLTDRTIDVLTNPSTPDGRYQHEQIKPEDERLALPHDQTIAVSDILPPV